MRVRACACSRQFWWVRTKFFCIIKTSSGPGGETYARNGWVRSSAFSICPSGVWSFFCALLLLLLLYIVYMPCRQISTSLWRVRAEYWMQSSEMKASILWLRNCKRISRGFLVSMRCVFGIFFISTVPQTRWICWVENSVHNMEYSCVTYNIMLSVVLFVHD